jgi:hypothetical protein
MAFRGTVANFESQGGRIEDVGVFDAVADTAEPQKNLSKVISDGGIIRPLATANTNNRKGMHRN